MGHEHRIEIEGEFVGEASRGSGRLVAVAAVLTTLAAATTGYMQAGALRAHDEADVRAERLGALAVNVSAANRDQAQIQIDRYFIFQREEKERERARTAARRDHSRAALLEANRWAYVARITARDTRAIADGQQLEVSCSATAGRCQHRGLIAICSAAEAHACGAGAWYGNDRLVTIRYEQAAQWERYRLDFEREAANAQADAAQTRFAHLAAALTMLTVAVFLFGYSLTPQGRENRKLFLTCATLFLLAGVGWSASHGFPGDSRAPVEAANAFADGEVAYEDGDVKRAITHLARATDLWPGSGTAYAELALAKYELSDPATVPSIRTLKESVADDERALEDGSESPIVTHDLAGVLLFIGLRANSNDEIVRARDLSEHVASKFVGQQKEGKHPGYYLIDALFTVAEGDLALGSAATQGAYCRATRAMVALQAEGVSREQVYEEAEKDIRLIVQARQHYAHKAAALLRSIAVAASTDTAPLCAPGL